MNKFLNKIIENNKDYLDDIATKIKEVILELDNNDPTSEEFEAALEKKCLSGYLDMDNDSVDIMLPKFNHNIKEKYLYPFITYQLDFEKK